jgi:DNA end-binding protein Ku
VRSFWKGAVSFGLVHIPVRLYAATESKDPHFRYLHAPCVAPVRYEKVCTACGKAVPDDELVLGYPHDGGYAVLTKEELRHVEVGDAQTIAVLQFTEAGSVDPVFLERHYYVEPQGGGEKAYGLLRRAMAAEGQHALCRIRLRRKTALSLLRPYGDRTLLLETMVDADEVRPSAALAIPQTDAVEREEGMARQLIRSLTAPFRPEAHPDLYRATLERLVNAKAPTLPDPRAAPVDLLEALAASIARLEGGGSGDVVAHAGRRGDGAV